MYRYPTIHTMRQYALYIHLLVSTWPCALMYLVFRFSHAHCECAYKYKKNENVSNYNYQYLISLILSQQTAKLAVLTSVPFVVTNEK